MPGIWHSSPPIICRLYTRPLNCDDSASRSSDRRVTQQTGTYQFHGCHRGRPIVRRLASASSTSKSVSSALDPTQKNTRLNANSTLTSPRKKIDIGLPDRQCAWAGWMESAAREAWNGPSLFLGRELRPRRFGQAVKDELLDNCRAAYDHQHLLVLCSQHRAAPSDHPPAAKMMRQVSTPCRICVILC